MWIPLGFVTKRTAKSYLWVMANKDHNVDSSWLCDDLEAAPSDLRQVHCWKCYKGEPTERELYRSTNPG